MPACGTSVSKPRLLDYQFSHVFTHDVIALRDSKTLTRNVISITHHVQFAVGGGGRMGKRHRRRSNWVIKAGAQYVSQPRAPVEVAGDERRVAAIKRLNQLSE